MKKVSGFTLVELLVAMAIIGVLIALAIYGVSAAQRAQRDTSRKSSAQDISVGIQDYYDRNSNYPNTVSFSVSGENAYVYLSRQGDACTAATNKCILVPLKGNMRPNMLVGATLFAKSSAIAYLGADTTAENTRYCLHIEDDGYTLGALLENDTWIHVGSTANPSTCVDAVP